MIYFVRGEAVVVLNSIGISPTAPEEAPLDAIKRATETSGVHFSQEMQLAFMVLTFALVALIFLYLITRSGRATPFVLRIYTITIIVFGSLVVVSSAYSNNQVASVIGLFGTIAGYVLGRSERNAERADAPPPSDT